MTEVAINGRTFDVDLIVFDKDGTLIKLDVWGYQLEKWGKLLQQNVDLTDAEIETIYAQLGYDIETRKLRPDTPIVVGSIEQIQTISAFLLHDRGISWTAAEQMVQVATDASLDAPPEPSMFEMIGDVPGTLRHLYEQKIQIGVATSDNRHSTERTLEILGIDALIQSVVCADDPIPMKPAPDGLFHIGRELGVLPSRMLMVGDSIGDMACGRAAGVAGCIRIGPEAEGATDVADVTIRSVDEIQVL